MRLLVSSLGTVLFGELKGEKAERCLFAEAAVHLFGEWLFSIFSKVVFKKNVLRN